MATRTVFSLNEVRLANTSGHVCIVPARTPKTIPEELFLEAVKGGCVEYNAAMLDALKAVGNQAPPDDGGSIDAMKVAEQAVKQVLLAAESQPELLTSIGAPRVPAVRAAFEVLCSDAGVSPDLRITQDLVTSLFEQVNQATEAAEVQVAPSEAAGADLAGEEVGGLDLEALGKGDYDAE